MKSRFVFVASCLSFLTAGSCTSSNPAQVDMAGADMSVAAADLSETTPPDFATQPPDLVPGCGFGQELAAGTGTCACDAKHTTLCGGNTYCCGAAQNCIPAPGPRGETRCSGPSVREAAALGFDPLRKNLILSTGGCLNSAMSAILCTDQWMLSQITWDTQQPTTVITPRFGSTMTWLPSKNQLVLFGGQTTQNNATTAVNDLYAWSGSDWTKLAPALSPSKRAFTAMAYDSFRQALVLFGGVDANNASQSDTWEYSNTSGNWKTITPANNVPKEREGMGMVYDTTIKKTVMHGGFLAGGAYGRDTWTWDGNDWTQLPDNTAVPLHGYFGMAFDSDRKVTVLFGGETTNGATLDETWEFNGTTWSKKTPTLSPSKRSKPAMAYDAERKQMIVFGGNNANLLKDMWAWDGTNWTQLY